jgi:hypothetical protein
VAQGPHRHCGIHPRASPGTSLKGTKSNQIAAFPSKLLNNQAWAASFVTRNRVRLKALTDLFFVCFSPFSQAPWGHPKLKPRLQETGADLGRNRKSGTGSVKADALILLLKVREREGSSWWVGDRSRK